MALLNRIINILVLLAAIAAVVFSYLLFSKREKLVDGWAQMAKAINTAAKTLDDGGASALSAAKDLPEDKLKHSNYDQLGQVLPKLKDNVSKVVVQRNELSQAMHDAAKTLAISGVDSKNLKSVTAYKDQERIFTKGVNQFRSNRDALSKEYVRTFKQFDADVAYTDLINPDKFRSAIAKGNLKVQDVVDRKKTFSSYLTKIAKAAEVSVPQVSGKAYKTELDITVKAVREKTSELKTAKKQLAAEKRKNKDLTQKLAAQRKSMQDLNRIKKSKEKEIQRLTNILNKDNTIKLPEKMLTSKDAECYKYVRGIIEYVDREYGFVTVNMGNNYSFIQQYGIKPNRVAFPMSPGKVLTVVRDPDSANPLFIGKVTISKVDDNSSICNLISGKIDMIQEGDSVLFTEEDIVKAIGNSPKKSVK